MRRRRSCCPTCPACRRPSRRHRRRWAAAPRLAAAGGGVGGGGGGSKPERRGASGLAFDASNLPAADLVGFMPLRGEYDTEWEDEYEKYIADVEFLPTDTPDERAHKLQVLAAYNRILDERQRRRDFVQAHEVIERAARHHSMDRRLSREERQFRVASRPYAQHTSVDEHEGLMKATLKEAALRKRAEHLVACASAGIKSINEANTLWRQALAEDEHLGGNKPSGPSSRSSLGGQGAGGGGHGGAAAAEVSSASWTPSARCAGGAPPPPPPGSAAEEAVRYPRAPASITPPPPPPPPPPEVWRHGWHRRGPAGRRRARQARRLPRALAASAAPLAAQASMRCCPPSRCRRRRSSRRTRRGRASRSASRPLSTWPASASS